MQVHLIDPRVESRNEEVKRIQGWVEQGKFIVAVEVSIPFFADIMSDLEGQGQALVIDPQHQGAVGQNISAIRWTYERIGQGCSLDPDREVVYLTVRPDVDAFGAIALLHNGVDGVLPHLVEMIDRADCARTNRWSPRPLFSLETPGYEHHSLLGPVQKMIRDQNLWVETRVGETFYWLKGYKLCSSYEELCQREREEISAALKNGEIKVKVIRTGKDLPDIAFVRSTHRAATSIAYSRAPIGVAFNPEFRFGGGEPHLKISVFQWSEGYFDTGAIIEELQALEPDFFGSSTFLGSTQGQASAWDPADVVEVVGRHLIPQL